MFNTNAIHAFHAAVENLPPPAVLMPALRNVPAPNIAPNIAETPVTPAGDEEPAGEGHQFTPEQLAVIATMPAAIPNGRTKAGKPLHAALREAGLKRCSGCSTVKPVGAFGIHKRDGLRAQCRPCDAAHKARKRTDPEYRAAAAEYQRRYDAENAEAKAERKRQRRINPETRDEFLAQRRAENARRRARLRGALPSWAKSGPIKAEIDAIFAACPPGYEVEHVVALAGSPVLDERDEEGRALPDYEALAEIMDELERAFVEDGEDRDGPWTCMHVPWNLGYLPTALNVSKLNHPESTFRAAYYAERNPVARWGAHQADLPRPFPPADEVHLDRRWTLLTIELLDEPPEDEEIVAQSVGLSIEDIVPASIAIEE